MTRLRAPGILKKYLTTVLAALIVAGITTRAESSISTGAALSAPIRVANQSLLQPAQPLFLPDITPAPGMQPVRTSPFEPNLAVDSSLNRLVVLLQFPVLIFIAIRLIGLAFKTSEKRGGTAEAIHDRHEKARPEVAVRVACGQHHIRLRWILAGGVAAILGVSLLFQLRAEVGRPALYNAILLSVLPLPIWIVLTQWIHRFKSEPTRMLVAAFFWGATVACFFSLRANVLFARWMVRGYGEDAVVLGAVLSAPWVEEALKGAFLLFLFFWKSARFDDVIDGIVYASMIGLGFAMMENVLYFGRAIQAGGALLPKMFLVRQVMGPFIHPFFTCMFGIGLGFSRETDDRVVRFVAPVAGFFLAMFLHYTWNLTGLVDALLNLAVTNGILQRPVPFYLYFYFLFMFPGFVAVITLILFQLGREGNVISNQLLPEVQSGVLTGEDLKRLATVRGRTRAGFDAFFKRGLRRWRLQRKFHQVASELAFHRYRVAHGMSEKDLALESAFVEQLHRVLPPPLPVKAQAQPA